MVIQRDFTQIKLEWRLLKRARVPRWHCDNPTRVS